MPPRRKQQARVTGPSVVSIAEPRPRRTTSGDSGATRLPPVPGRADRDRAAARKPPPLKPVEAAPEPVDAADTAPTIPPPIAPPALTRPEEAASSDGANQRREPQLLTPDRATDLDDWGEPDEIEVARRAVTSDWELPEDEDDIHQPGSRDDYTMPPTRISRDEAPVVVPVPEVPESGMWPAVKYLVQFLRARWQRRSVIRTLREQIKTDTASLDSVLGVLGREVRVRGIDNRVLEAENEAIDQAEKRKATADREFSELQNKQAEENNRFAEIESDRDEKVSDAETALEEAKQELGSLEAQRRGLREKRKSVDRQIAGLIKNAETREAEAAKLEMGEPRQELRRAAEGLRRDAAALDPERQDIDRRLAALERPLSKASAKVEAIKAELESARRSLNDAREGHRHRLSEIEAERGRKSRELAQADAEIQRRLVTLGTLVNLNRIDSPDLVDLYARIDVLRGAIGSRTTEIDRLSAEREAYDKRALTRGALVLGGAFLVLCLILAIVAW